MLLVGCARTAHLYPISADNTGTPHVLTATFISSGTGHGSITIPLPSGEILKGEFSVVRGGTIGFGSIIANAYGTGGYASGSALGTGYSMQGASHGMASAVGDKGTSMQCEFYNDNWSGHGYGACKASTGTLYRLQY